MSKFFVRSENIQGNSINIQGDDVNHIKKVLRLRCGDCIRVCDGEGTDYTVQIQDMEQNTIKTSIVATEANRAEPPVEITLFQGVPKSDKMDFIIQKCVELGVSKIIPVMTERTVVRMDSRKDSENKCSRWQRIALEASKQCNRGVVPEISMPLSFSESLKLTKEYDISLIPYEKEAEKGLKTLLRSSSESKRISVFIGPEGGFSEKEVELAMKADVRPVTLGPRILRTETAGLSVISILMYELGDVGK